MRFFLRKENRLYTEKEISVLFKDGFIHFIYPIKVVYLTLNNNDEKVTFMVSVSKRNFKRAVQRNLIKRRVKEAFRKNLFLILKALEGKQQSINIAFIYISNNVLTYKEIEDNVVKHILNLTNRIEKVER